MADLARHIDVRQEVHGDDLDAVTLTGFTAAAFDVERETAFVITAQSRLRCLGIDITDIVEYTGIGSRIGTRCTADRILVDLYKLVDILQSLDEILYLPGPDLLSAEVLQNGFHEDVVDQCGFAGAGYAGNDDQLAEREFHIDLLQIMLFRRL